MSDKLNIEELFQTRLEGAELSPSPASWKAVQRKLRWQQFLRFNPGRFNIYYTGALLLAGVGLVWILSGNNEQAETLVPEEQSFPISPEERLNAEGSGELEQAGKKESRSDGIQSINSDNNAIIEADSIMHRENQEGDTALTEKDSDLSLKNATAAPIVPAGIETDPQDQQQSVAYFTNSIQSGCAPLTVQFIDQSIHATSHYWDFGTGETSREQNPHYEFSEAGRFVVTLTTENHGSLPTVSRMMVEVLAAPVADFQIEEGLVGIDNHVVLTLVNYSSDGSAFTWDLVDEDCTDCSDWSSMEHQPALELKAITPDSRSVRLEVINEQGCSDTAIQELPLIVQSSKTRIKFATAFSPNPSGPGDGSFTPGSKRIDLFYPIYIEVPVEFRMRIYTRRGELVFETREIYQGWDGYHNQEAVRGDVYVWMVEGKWTDGESFSLHGDVTLVKNKYW